MTLNFNKTWASDTNPDYPTDMQEKRGLSFLGTEAPTFDLHDALFQRLDIKALWLYDQVRTACERFGQKVQNDNGDLASDARDVMANAITYALINQRKADEGGYGIVCMANADQTNAGQDYNLAVSPKHLTKYVASQNTWENTKDKPQTATRWPNYDEVTNKPSFDPKGSAAVVNKNLENEINKLRQAAYCDIYDDGNPDNLVWGNSKLTTESTVKGVYQRLQDLFSRLGSAAYTSSSGYDAAGAALTVQNILENEINKLIGLLKSAAYTESSAYDPAGTSSNLESRLNNGETVNLYGLKNLHNALKYGEYIVSVRRGPERYLTNYRESILRTEDGCYLTGVQTAPGDGIYGYYYREVRLGMQNGDWRTPANDENN